MSKRTRNTIIAGAVYLMVKWAIILLAGNALYKSGYWSNWFLAIFPVIGITVLLIRRKIKNKNRGYVEN